MCVHLVVDAIARTPRGPVSMQTILQKTLRLSCLSIEASLWLYANNDFGWHTWYSRQLLKPGFRFQMCGNQGYRGEWDRDEWPCDMYRYVGHCANSEMSNEGHHASVQDWYLLNTGKLQNVIGDCAEAG